MNQEVKSKFIEDAQKLITRECSSRCKVNDEACYQSCYKFCLKSLSITTKVLREEGYKKFSRYINLAYGKKSDEWENLVLFSDKEPDLMGYPDFYFEQNMYENSE